MKRCFVESVLMVFVGATLLGKEQSYRLQVAEGSQHEAREPRHWVLIVYAVVLDEEMRKHLNEPLAFRLDRQI